MVSVNPNASFDEKVDNFVASTPESHEDPPVTVVSPKPDAEESVPHVPLSVEELVCSAPSH